MRPSGRAFAGMLAVFAEFERDILRDRVKAGIAQARKDGKPHGRPATIAGKAQEVRKLVTKGLNNSAIAKQLNIGRTSVRRLLANGWAEAQPLRVRFGTDSTMTPSWRRSGITRRSRKRRVSQLTKS